MTQTEQCKAPKELREGDLIAYLEGAAPPCVMEHLAHCPAHQLEVAELQAIDSLLQAALFRIDCPLPEELLQYHAGLLVEPERRRVEQHLKSCAACREELGELQAAAGSESWAGSTLIEFLERAGRQVLRAVLVKSSAVQPALAIRGSESRQLEFQTDGYQLLLSLVSPVAAENRWLIEGQVLTRGSPVVGGAGDIVQLLATDRVVASDRVDEFGFFVLDEIGSGHYTLHIQVGATHIVIEDLDVG